MPQLLRQSVYPLHHFIFAVSQALTLPKLYTPFVIIEFLQCYMLVMVYKHNVSFVIQVFVKPFQIWYKAVMRVMSE